MFEIQTPSTATAESPILSVVICTYNNAAGLSETLRHLQTQRPVPGAWEVIVVDNNCSDDTASVVAAQAKAMPELRHVLEPRQGLMHARTCGVSTSRGQIVAFVDDDNYLSEDWLAQALDFLHHHPACGAFGGTVEILWGAPPPPEIVRRAYAYAGAEMGGEARRLDGQDRWQVRGAGLVCRKAPLIASGWLDWQLCAGRVGLECMAGDDTEIVMRIARQGWEVWHVPQCKLQHAILARRINIDYLRALHYGFGLADPLLFGLRDRGTFLRWAVRFLRFCGHRFLLWLGLWIRGWSDSESRLEAVLVLTTLRGAMNGVAPIARLTPIQRSLWLGQSAAPSEDPPTSARAVEPAPSSS